MKKAFYWIWLNSLSTLQILVDNQVFYAKFYM